MTEDENSMNDGTESPEMKECPFCGEKILARAKKCRFCGEFLSNGASHEDSTTPPPGPRTQTSKPRILINQRTAPVPNASKNADDRKPSGHNDQSNVYVSSAWSALSAASSFAAMQIMSGVMFGLWGRFNQNMLGKIIWWLIGIGVGAGILHTLSTIKTAKTSNAVISNWSANFGILLALITAVTFLILQRN